MSHALLSPSKAHRWAACPGSVPLSAGYPEDSSKYADEGSDAHQLAALCLTSGQDAAAYLGRKMDLGHEVDDDMVAAVQVYLDRVRAVIQPGYEVAIEVPRAIGWLTGEDGAEGTPDCTVVGGCVVDVFDYKHGKGVLVDPENNLQLLMYAAAVVRDVELVEPIEEIRMHIAQPRAADGGSDAPWIISRAELDDRVSQLTRAAHMVWASTQATPDGRNETWQAAYLEPGEDQCKWCRAKADCPALGRLSTEMVESDLEGLPDLDATLAGIASAPGAQLADWYSKVSVVLQWAEAVKVAAFESAERGELPGFKLVRGKRGARQWANPAEAEATLKSMRLREAEMYDFKVISPTSAEKLLKKDSPRRWHRLEPLITQTEGKPTLVPQDDPRPALPRAVEGLINYESAEDLV